MSDAPEARVATIPVVHAGGKPAPEVITITAAVLNDGLTKAHDKGKREERAAQVKARGAALEAQAAAHQQELQRVAGETVQRERAAHAHGFHKAAWMFGSGGAALGAALTVLVMLITLRAGTESTVQGAATGSMIRAQDEYRRDLRMFERNEIGAPPEE